MLPRNVQAAVDRLLALFESGDDEPRRTAPAEPAFQNPVGAVGVPSP